MASTGLSRGLKGKDLITVGIFSAIYFVINFVFMLLSAIHPMLWILMPGLIAMFTGIPFLLMCAKVQKPGAVLLMGIITGLIYYLTGMFTVIIMISFLIACGLAEFSRVVTRYTGEKGNFTAFVLFSLGMTGSPLPLWLTRDSFFAQLSSQGMPVDYIETLNAASSPAMLVVLFSAPVIGAVLGGFISRGMFKKHFVKAGIV